MDLEMEIRNQEDIVTDINIKEEGQKSMEILEEEDPAVITMTNLEVKAILIIQIVQDLDREVFLEVKDRIKIPVNQENISIDIVINTL